MVTSPAGSALGFAIVSTFALIPGVVVAQSLGGFTAPLVCARVPVEALVFVNAMIPMPGEKAEDWGDNTGAGKARAAAARKGGYPAEFDDQAYFFHDVPKKVAKEAEAHDGKQSNRVMEDPCRFESWPRVPIHVIAGRDDRLFPVDFQRRVARERLEVEIVGSAEAISSRSRIRRDSRSG